MPAAPPTVGDATASKTSSAASAAAKSDALTFQVLLHDVWGEQSLRLLLEEWIPPRTASAAASGWGGDRIVVYERGSERAVAWLLESDDLEAAERLYRALGRGAGLDAEGRLTTAESQGNTPCVARAQLGSLAVGRRGTRVALVAGPYDRAGGPTGAPADPAQRVRLCQRAAGWIQTLLDQK